MTLTLDPATEQLLQQELATGRYREPAELLAHALDLVESKREDDSLLRNKEAINATLDESFATKERGEFYSPEEVRAEMEARLTLPRDTSPRPNEDRGQTAHGPSLHRRHEDYPRSSAYRQTTPSR